MGKSGPLHYLVRVMNARLDRRSAGLLLHPTSLPGPFESGDLGPSAHRFIDTLADAGQTWWQMLPLGPAGPGFSPYASTSMFAGDPLLVSLEALAARELLAKDDPALAPVPHADRIDHVAARDRRRPALDRAYDAFAARGGDAVLEAFAQRNASWASDYALFAALKRAHGDASFRSWPEGLRRRDPRALAEARRDLGREIRREHFAQWAFSEQLDDLRAHARARGVGLIGDVPIFVDDDSAEVWARPELFELDRAGGLESVAGVPPDAFSDEGQLWGNPLWSWDAIRARGYDAWIERMASAFARFDAVRLDHFIGFSRFWAVPRSAKSAKAGTYRPGPGAELFEAIFRALGPVQLIAEDLGVLTDEVRALRDRFRLPGMCVAVFSFAPGAEDSRLHAFPVRSVAYTGTHDNDTARGWIASPPADASTPTRTAWEKEKAFALEYLSTDEEGFADALVRAVYRSSSTTAITPVQDVLGLGREARMNRPGIADGNWSYRMTPGALEAAAPRLARMCQLYGRTRET